MNFSLQSLAARLRHEAFTASFPRRLVFWFCALGCVPALLGGVILILIAYFALTLPSVAPVVDTTLSVIPVSLGGI